MKTYKKLYEKLCSWKNLEEAYTKARKHKSHNRAVLEFEKNKNENLNKIMTKLRDKNYSPIHLKRFVLRDPKTRIICVSDFSDRIIHHALVNVLQPIFEPRFIHDSYASQKGKGTHSALKRFELFVRQLTKNGTQTSYDKHHSIEGFVLKADIKQYFNNVNHELLLSIISEKIKDSDVLRLCRIILQNYQLTTFGKGMPLGNWTSQFFANIYLNKLDQFVKHKLQAKYYIRYVDDFIILHSSKPQLEKWQKQVGNFLQKELKLELHPQKSKVTPLSRGIDFLGFKCFHNHKILRKRNVRKRLRKLEEQKNEYNQKLIDASDIFTSLQGWNAYAIHANTYNLRRTIMNKVLDAIKKPIQDSLPEKY